MAASGFTPISLYYSTTASAVPTSGNLANGELGLNIADMKLYAKNSAGTVTLLASNAGASGSVTSVSGTGTVNGLTLTGTVTTSGSLTLGGTLSLVSPPPIGSTTPNTGAFSSLTVNGGLLFNANGDSSSATGEIKQLTGSGLTIYSKTGSSYDFTLLNAGGSNLMRVPTGTSNLEITQTNALFTGTGLGIGIAPTTKLDVYTNSATTYAARIYNNNAYGGLFLQTSSTSSSTYNLACYNSAEYLLIVRDDGAVIAGGSTAVSGYKLTVNGQGAFAGPTSDVDGNGGVRINYGNSTGLVQRFLTLNANGTTNAAIGLNMVDASNGGITFSTREAGTLYERFRINYNSAWGIGGANYGTAGQVLTSGGSGAAPTWATAGGGSQAFVAFGSTGGY